MWFCVPFTALNSTAGYSSPSRSQFLGTIYKRSVDIQQSKQTKLELLSG
jgi:ribosomal protein S10